MIFYSIPKFYNVYSNVQVEIINFNIPEIDFSMDKKDLILRKPYPNKNYLVACKKRGKKAIEGIIVDADLSKSFNVVIDYLINNEIITIHKIKYHILDHSYDLISDRLKLAAAWAGTKYKSRIPDLYLSEKPCDIEPKTFTSISDVESIVFNNSLISKNYSYKTNKSGIITCLEQDYYVNTIEKEKLYNKHYNDISRMPDKEDIFIT